MIRWTHPGFRELNHYVDGELDERSRGQVAAHLAGCSRCRATVERIRGLGAAARALDTPPLPGNLLGHVLDRRAAGERVILPTAAPGRPKRRRAVGTRIAAGIAAVVAAGALALLTPEVEAGATDLSIDQTGAELAFEYRDAGLFAGQEQLALRARYRTVDREYKLTAGYLEQRDDGLYHGRLTLPDPVVYAVFVVEDLAGVQLDTNQGAFWEVMQRDPDGEPTYAALMARVQDLFGRDWEASLETAELAVERFPDRPGAWAALHALQTQILDDDSLSERHEVQVRRLDGVLRTRENPTPGDMGALAVYAYQNGDQATARYWAERAMVDPAAVPPVHRASLVSILFPDPAQAGEALAYLDDLWRSADPALPVARRGADIATRTRDPDGRRFWYERTRGFDRHRDLAISTDLLEWPALRAYAIDEVRRQLAEYSASADDEDRALEHSVPREQRYRTEQAARVQVALGQALIQEGRTGEGLAELRLAISHLWSPELLQQAADLLLEHGDVETARTAFVRLAADPSLPAARKREIEETLGPAARSSWADDVVDARMELEQELFADAFTRYVRGAVPLRAADGTTLDLDDVIGGEVAVVAYWSARCAPALEDVPDMNRTATLLERHGIPFIVVATQAHSPWLDARLEAYGARFSVLSDVRARVESEFGSGATPEYYVLDERGRIRFRSELDLVAQRAILLKGRAATVAVAEPGR